MTQQHVTASINPSQVERIEYTPRTPKLRETSGPVWTRCQNRAGYEAARRHTD